MHDTHEAKRSAAEVAVALWGVLGILAVLASAIARLTPIALEALQGPLGAFEWVVTVAWVGWMLYAEGYRGFQRGYSPRVVARAFLAGRGMHPVRVALAPLFCMSLFHARRRTLVVSWSVLMGVVGLVLLVRLLPQPWRGMVDAGVVLGLTWGAASIVVIFVRALWCERHVPWAAAALPDAATREG